ncbi:MAG: UDP-N-acetylglucosamine diphosphorylase/glucosamine-1-phosphate N-acetyltransferase [Gammaproteobacteria bacterium]|nr:UDP-N-acetylglucosamine diphosphorylase/glucosamine-1-phosphate N-acetyltransferase [Gammaproteobacteria bacterium]
MSLEVVILAAGAGKRMRSGLPKVLHEIGGCSLLTHVVRTAETLSPKRIHVVYGHGGDIVRERLSALDVHWVEQRERLGTGHAVQQALPHLEGGDRILVLYGDVPLLTTETLTHLLKRGDSDNIAILTAVLDEPHGYGRILRDDAASVTAIVEHRDATPEQLEVKEINSGIMVLPSGRLAGWLNALGNDNDQQEYYLTDVVEMAVADGVQVTPVVVDESIEVMGVNDRHQLATLERYYQYREACRLMREGVTLRDPARIDVRGDVTIGEDCEIDVDVVLEGNVRIGRGCSIGPFCHIKNAVIADNVVIRSHTVIEDAEEIGQGAIIGPYARIRPGTRLAPEVHVGNFVEIKKSDIGRGSKVNHLSYIGDTDMGAKVNVGAGTITCNYDGANKFRTTIGNDVFIGSDTQLVAPVKVGDGATIGAGSTITRDAPEGELTLSRVPQKTRPGWQRPKKKS